jgi:hypothetical protein
VRALEAVHAQKYWEALDALFTKQNRWTRIHSADPGGILKAPEDIGLGLPRPRQDMMASPNITRILETDRADAKALLVLLTEALADKHVKRANSDAWNGACIHEELRCPLHMERVRVHLVLFDAVRHLRTVDFGLHLLNVEADWIDGAPNFGAIHDIVHHP